MWRLTYISIHVPREGHDESPLQFHRPKEAFQSTCPARGTTVACPASLKTSLFQSTCPARGTTATAPHPPPRLRNFNPRAPRGARLQASTHDPQGLLFQSTCPARGTTSTAFISLLLIARFQSTCPARGTTQYKWRTLQKTIISIHVPREGHDLHRLPQSMLMAIFQSTCPARGTTTLEPRIAAATEISIHVPREGHDNTIPSWCQYMTNFNPRAPRGARPPSKADFFSVICYFNPRAPRGARRWTISGLALSRPFQSTCPARGTTANMHNFFVQICAKVTTIPLKGMPYTRKMHVSL